MSLGFPVCFSAVRRETKDFFGEISDSFVGLFSLEYDKSFLISKRLLKAIFLVKRRLLKPILLILRRLLKPISIAGSIDGAAGPLLVFFLTCESWGFVNDRLVQKGDIHTFPPNSLFCNICNCEIRSVFNGIG